MSDLPSGFIDRLLWDLSGDLGRVIYRLLIDEQAAWQSERGYWLKHPGRKISIWIANAAYGLRLQVGDGPNYEDIRPTWAERKLIERAVKQLRIPSPESIRRENALRRIAQ